ncbi:MAG: hypothetical protein VX930_00435, partial [Pseudomonadota bacterium]|nr:hypothetical protein [Pseudomonadota bacterium]
ARSAITAASSRALMATPFSRSFPIDGEEGRAAAAATVDAAVQASDRINVLNGSANAGKRKPIGFGIGLHMGSVT